MREIHGIPVYDSLREITDPKHTALLVVDMQNDFCTEGGHASRTQGHENQVADCRQILPNLIEFIDESRKTGILIVWIQHTYLPGWKTDNPAWFYHWLKTGMRLSDIPFCEEGTWGWDIINELKPIPLNEPTVRKYRTSSFISTYLDLLLRSNKIESVLVTGTHTRACVEMTAISATMHDYYTVLVKDCCAPYDKSLMTNSWYDVVNYEEILKEWSALMKSK